MRNRNSRRMLERQAEVTKRIWSGLNKQQRRIRNLMIALLSIEFVALGVGCALISINHYVTLIVAVVVFFTTVILGANMPNIKRSCIKRTILRSKLAVEKDAQVETLEREGMTVTNNVLTKVVLKFTFTIEEQELIGYKPLKVQKLMKIQDFQSNEKFKSRLAKFLDSWDAQGQILRIKYIPSKPRYCVILNSADEVFNYFILDVCRKM